MFALWEWFPNKSKPVGWRRLFYFEVYWWRRAHRILLISARPKIARKLYTWIKSNYRVCLSSNFSVEYRITLSHNFSISWFMQDVIKIHFDVCAYKIYYIKEFILQIYQKLKLAWNNISGTLWFSLKLTRIIINLSMVKGVMCHPTPVTYLTVQSWKKK